MSLTPEEFEQKLKNSANEFARAFNNAPFLAISDFNGVMQQRIFGNGKAADGTQIGTYDDKKKQTFLTKKAKPSLTKKQSARLTKLEGKGESLTYKELRELKGLQTAYVDLQFTGDLRQSITEGTENNRAILRINNSEEQEIAGFLTEKYKKPIFQPSEQERKEAKELMILFIQDEIKKIIATWR